MNYFEFYGLRPGLLLDLRELKNKFLLFSRQYHPDHFAFQNDSDQSDAEEKSALNNKAYKTLLDPDLRIKYVLELKGRIKEEEILTLSPDFLMEMMEINDLILENPELARTQLKNIELAIEQEARPVLTSFDYESPAEQDLNGIKEYYYKRRYILRLMDNLNKFAPGQSL
ncbi:MAG: Fe-S protein assembly co-chaperone HscB [Saprospiraceae bacterium]|nr:Fe-S protein assembly co-chaperone HscB [Saprospiraceae bacterium]